MDGQTITALSVVAIAIAILIRRAVRWASGSCESACGGCQKPPAQIASEKIITEDEISLPTQ